MPLMNEEALKAWILRMLGHPTLQVELTDPHLADAVESARRWFAVEKGVDKKAIVPIVGGVVEYSLPADCVGVMNVVFPLAPFDLSLIYSPFMVADEKIPYDVFASSAMGGLYSTFTQNLQYIEMAKRVLGAEPDFNVDIDNMKVVISPMPKVGGGGAFVLEYRSNNFSLETLNEVDHSLVKGYALACAKWTLGRIRSKYDSMAVAGGAVQMDGAVLIAEAKEEIEKLEVKIVGKQGPMVFSVA